MPTSVRDRLCAAPISWGVCEAPGWGHEMPPDRVLAEMHDLGLHHTELGPTGYLGAGPSDVRATLDAHDLRLVGGFLPVVMHRPSDLTAATDAMDVLAAGGAEVVVLAAQSAADYEVKVRLTDAEWSVLLDTLQTLQTAAAERGLRASLHPHVGTAVEDRDSVLRVLDDSDVPLCLDTGHLVIGGMLLDELLTEAADRVQHVHLKDVNTAVAATVTDGSRSYLDAVRAGLYTPLGAGDLDIAGCVATLESIGYDGWYVLEQDCALAGEPAVGAGPIDDVRRSIDYVTSAA